MKPLLRKIPAMLAMLIGLFSFFLYAQYLFNGVSDVWIGSAIFATLSVPFFFVDAIISLVRAIKKDDSKFNYILALVLIGAIPMVMFLGGSGRDFLNVIWNLYYLLVFALEIISIKKACAALKANRKNAKESAEAND